MIALFLSRPLPPSCPGRLYSIARPAGPRRTRHRQSIIPGGEVTLRTVQSISNATAAYICIALACPVLRIGPECANLALDQGQNLQASLPFFTIGNLSPGVLSPGQRYSSSPRPKLSQSTAVRKLRGAEPGPPSTVVDIPAILQFVPDETLRVATRRICVTLAAIEDAFS